MGTDYGPVPISPREHVEIVESLNLGEENEAKIRWKNADQLYRLGLGSGIAAAPNQQR